MKNKSVKLEVKNKINEFFKKEKFDAKDIKKIKRFAAKYNIKLGKFRRRFCKKCLHLLKGKLRVSKSYKSVVCDNCGYRNKFKLS